MKKTLLALLFICIGFIAYSQPKMIQQSNINDFSIRWIHDTKEDVDFLELCKSPKFDDIVYRFVAEDNSGIELVIPTLESVNKVFGNGIKINDDIELSLSSADIFSFGMVLSMFASSSDMSTSKRLYDLTWCKCLCVYESLNIEDFTYSLSDMTPSL